MCFPFIILYCYDIPEQRYVSCVKYGLALSRPCETCMATGNDIQNQEMPNAYIETNRASEKHV